MTYFKPTDTIDKIGLSFRSHNALRRAGIHTIAELLEYDRGKLREIQQLGAKSTSEINNVLDTLTFESGGYRTLSVDETNALESGMSEIPMFRGADGLLRVDFLLEEIGLSIRSYNALKSAGYDYASQLIDITEKELLSLKNIGGNSADEILNRVKSLVFANVSIESSTVRGNVSCQNFTNNIVNILTVHGGVLYQEMLPIFENAVAKCTPVKPRDLFTVEYLRSAVKLKLLDFISTFEFGTSKFAILDLFPDCAIDQYIIDEILDEMESDGLIIIGNKIERQKMTILEYAKSVLNDIDRDILFKRLRGLTLEEIGQHIGVTRERIRQIVARSLMGRPVLVEDKYTRLYEKYAFSRDDFATAFGEDDSVYTYLSIVCDKRGTQPIEQLLNDEAFTPELRRAAERAVFKNYLLIEGERVYKSRTEIVDYVVRTYCRNETPFDEFVEIYDLVIEEYGLEGIKEFTIDRRTYQNRLTDSNITLWKQGRRFRYYNIDGRDYTELWQGLALEQYQNMEYSVRKFFIDHPELMNQYNLLDEYELHNLLKKLSQRDGLNNIVFGRMPMITFGEADRDEQVLDMLLQMSPVTIAELASAYEDEYGVQTATFMANYLKSFDEYLHDGIYDISTPPLPSMHFARMNTVLNEDYYEISDIKRLYEREFPNEDIENINPHTIKTLGFSVYVSYAIRNTYLGATEYFRTLLTTDDHIDTRTFPTGVTGKISYTSELAKLKSQYEIIEYERSCFINIRRLNSVGVTIEELHAYCEAVAIAVDIGEYFTITSLSKTGFTHTLEDLGFGNVFYSSLITEDRRRFSYQRIGSTKVFRRGNKEATLIEFLEYIVEREVSIDIFAFVDLLSDQYGINVNRRFITSAVRNSSMHYDSIMERVYIDYNTYFEEV